MSSIRRSEREKKIIVDPDYVYTDGFEAASTYKRKQNSPPQDLKNIKRKNSKTEIKQEQSVSEDDSRSEYQESNSSSADEQDNGEPFVVILVFNFTTAFLVFFCSSSCQIECIRGFRPSESQVTEKFILSQQQYV